MKLLDVLCLQSVIYKLNFLFLYKAMVVGNWLQTFQQPIRVSYSKAQTSKTILSVKDIINFFFRKVLETISE